LHNIEFILNKIVYRFISIQLLDLVRFFVTIITISKNSIRVFFSTIKVFLTIKKCQFIACIETINIIAFAQAYSLSQV